MWDFLRQPLWDVDLTFQGKRGPERVILQVHAENDDLARVEALRYHPDAQIKTITKH